MSVHLRRRPFLDRLRRAPGMFLEHLRIGRDLTPLRARLAIAWRLTWVLLRGV